MHDKCKILGGAESRFGAFRDTLCPPLDWSACAQVSDEFTTFFFQGGLAIAVPGEVHGQYKAWKEYGRLPWEALVQPAINLAREGFRLSATVAAALKEMVEKIKTDPGLRQAIVIIVNSNQYTVKPR